MCIKSGGRKAGYDQTVQEGRKMTRGHEVLECRQKATPNCGLEGVFSGYTVEVVATVENLGSRCDISQPDL